MTQLNESGVTYNVVTESDYIKGTYVYVKELGFFKVHCFN